MLPQRGRPVHRWTVKDHLSDPVRGRGRERALTQDWQLVSDGDAGRIGEVLRLCGSLGCWLRGYALWAREALGAC
ncbi:hypothetical protein NDU88_006931 [Pleurodeles waltl]|uniref:Uncharacterized protein n=1 Tax=Pleurodeles waltl TaxID=8319 RepID=A0AAV7WDY8_PLEWA|nr:hypothetical protein NDU88_006931 [Pleurodeles waltl]